MPRARVTRPLSSSPAAAPPPAPHDHSENFGEQDYRLLNKRAAASASTNNTCIVVVETRPAEAEQPPQHDPFVEAAFYIKLKATLRVILFRDGVSSYNNTS